MTKVRERRATRIRDFNMSKLELHLIKMLVLIPCYVKDIFELQSAWLSIFRLRVTAIELNTFQILTEIEPKFLIA